MASTRATVSCDCSASASRPARPGPRRSAAAAPRAERAGDALPALDQRGDAVLAVAAEQLVGALAGQRDGDVLGGEPRQRQEAERREVGERLVEVPDQVA